MILLSQPLKCWGWRGIPRYVPPCSAPLPSDLCPIVDDPSAFSAAGGSGGWTQVDTVVSQPLLPKAGQLLTSGQAQTRAIWLFLSRPRGLFPACVVSLLAAETWPWSQAVSWGSLSKKSGKMNSFLYLLLLPAPLHRVPGFCCCYSLFVCFTGIGWEINPC